MRYWRLPVGAETAEKPDHWHRRLLRMRRERPNGDRTRNGFDKIAPPHSAPEERPHDIGLNTSSDRGRASPSMSDLDACY